MAARDGSEIYRRVSLGVWDDERFKALSRPRPNAQTLWFYLLTGPETTIIPGVVRSGPAGLAESLGWPVGALRACWNEISAKGMAKADWPVRLIWLPKALAQAHNRPKSSNQIKGWQRVFASLPASPLRVEIAASLGEALAKTDEKLRSLWDPVGTVVPTVVGTVVPTAVGTGVGTVVPTAVADPFERSSERSSAHRTGTRTRRSVDPRPGAGTHRFGLMLAHAVLDTKPETEADAADLLKGHLAKCAMAYDGRSVAKLLDEAGAIRARREVVCNGE